MSLSDPNYKPEVGDELFVIGRNGHRTYQAIVVKVGRKWAYVCNKAVYERDSERGEFDFECNQYHCDKFDFTKRGYSGRFHLDGEQYTSPGTVYASREEYEHLALCDKLWTEFARKVSHRGRKGMSLPEIRNIASLLDIELPPDEDLVLNRK